MTLRPAPSAAWLAAMLTGVALAGCVTVQDPLGPERCYPRHNAAQCVTRQPRPLSLLADNAPVTVQVDARCEWNPTGVILQRGARYHVAVTKVLEDWGGGPRLLDAASRYTQRWARAPALPLHALVGAQGRDERSYFVAGPEATFTAERGDELLFFSNTWPEHTIDNQGCVEVEIRQLAP
jgi:hypothetical protein